MTDSDAVMLHRLKQLRPAGRLALRGEGLAQYQWADAGDLLRYILSGTEWTTLVCTLTCGCAFQAHGPERVELLSRYKVDDWYGCPHHSDPVSFDSDTGEPSKYDRNQQLVSVVPL